MMSLIKMKTALNNQSLFEHFTDVPWILEIPHEQLDLVYSTRSYEKWVAPLVSRYLDDNKTHLTHDDLDTIAHSIQAIFGINWSKLWKAIKEEYSVTDNYNITTKHTETGTISDDSNITNGGSKTTVDTGTITDDGSVTNSGTKTTTDTGTITDNGTVTDSGTTSSNNEGNDINSLQGFNSTDFVNSDKNNSTGSSSSTTSSSQENGNTRTLDTSNTITDATSQARDNTRTLNTNNVVTDTTTQDRDNVRTLDTTEITEKKGNIGVMIYPYMLKAEIEVREWNFFEKVFADIDSLLTLSVY